MNLPSTPSQDTPPRLPVEHSRTFRPRSSWHKKLLMTGCVLLGVSGMGVASAALWYNYNLNASTFKPVQLSATEQQAMDAKILALEGEKQAATDPSKTIVLNEREINGYLESQGLGETVKVNISHGRLAATVLAPVERDVPVFGGHTIRFKVAFNTKLDEDHRFALSLADVTVGGISLPNAWLGGVKGLNLLAESEDHRLDNDFLKSLAAGIKDFQMKDGEVRVVLND